MKSNKAGEYIDKKKREDYPGGYLCYTLSEENAKKAVEIAEEEMREKAIEAFKITGSEICSVSGTVYKKFVDELNK